MKTALFLLLLLPRLADCQAIALIDRNLKAGLMLTQTVTPSQLSGGWFPIYAADLDSVICIAEDLVHVLKSGGISGNQIRFLEAGHTQFAVTPEGSGVHNSYGILVKTRAGAVGASLKIVHRGTGSRRAVQELLRFLDYLKNNRHLASAPLSNAALLQSPRLASIP